jgi:hypothetical protein
MTKKEYADYQSRVEAFFSKEGVNDLAQSHRADCDCGESCGCYDPHFSWQPCECCNRRLGGDRYDCTGYNPTNAEVQGPYSVCTDCLYYATYGKLDDSTMLEVERSAE